MASLTGLTRDGTVTVNPRTAWDPSQPAQTPEQESHYADVSDTEGVEDVRIRRNRNGTPHDYLSDSCEEERGPEEVSPEFAQLWAGVYKVCSLRSPVTTSPPSWLNPSLYYQAALRIS